MSQGINGNGNGNGNSGPLHQASKKAAPGQPTTPLSEAKETQVTFQTAEGTAFQTQPVRMTHQVVVFELYNPGHIPRFSEVLDKFKITLKGQTVYCGRAVVSKILDLGVKLVCEAMLEDAHWQDLNLALALQRDGQVAKEFKNFLHEWQKLYKVSPEFKIVIADMQTFLQDLHLWLTQVEMRLRIFPKEEKEQMERKIIEEIAQDVIPLVNALFEKFEAIIKNIGDDEKPMHGRYMRQHLHHLVLSAPFAQRTFVKPLGYAGDYEMVNMILRNGYEGNSLFAKVIHGWFVRQAPATAHRNRIKYLTGQLELETHRVARAGGMARIFNFACGPAVEVQNFLRSPLGERAELLLADFNKETLDYIGGIVAKIKDFLELRTCVRYQQKNIHQLLKESLKPAGGKKPEYDFVYCAGLFDYLTNHTCKQMMNVFYDLVVPGGLLVVTNVEPSNPLRHGMEQLLDWHLIYRRDLDMRELTPKFASQENVCIKTDPTGVNLFMEVRKPND
jgi:extracellular factor (EF) 3-hydroxypalmitic acid methyl ester biosynthesis protein